MTRAKRSTVLACAAVAAVVLVVVLLPFGSRPPEVLQMATAMVWMAAAIGLNLTTGYTHQISLAHGAFLAIGAYVTAILVIRTDMPHLATLPVAAAVTFLLGLLIGLPTLRLRGLHLTLVTITVAVALGPIIKRSDSLTGGLEGLFVEDYTAPSWLPLADDLYIYFTCAIVVTLLALMSWNMMRGRIGRAVRAIAQNELAASAMGVDAARVKLVIFAWSAMFAGIGGCLYTIVIGYVQPDGFSVLLGVYLLVAVVVGGPGTTVGPLIGALFIQYVPVWAGDVSNALAGVIYGVALIVVLLALPGGAVGGVRRLVRRFKDDGAAAVAGPPGSVAVGAAAVETPGREP